MKIFIGSHHPLTLSTVEIIHMYVFSTTYTLSYMENNYEETAPLLDRKVQELMSPNQFMILSIASFGLYPIWWSYKVWVFFRETEDSDVIPAARALFNWIFLSSLLQRIKDFSMRNGDRRRYNIALLHLGYLLFLLAGYLPEPYLFLSVLNALIFIQPLEAFNFGLLSKKKEKFNSEFGKFPLG